MQSALSPNIAVSSARPFHTTLAGQALLALAGSAFVAVCAHITVPLPFTPVPLSFVTLGVILVGLTLGPATAFSAMVLYLIEGASGIPVFSPHGPGGVLQLFGPTGGYLLSYPLAAAAAGAIVRTAKSPRLRFAAACVGGAVACCFFFAFGATWLAASLHLNLRTAMTMGVLPFLPGEIVKVAAAAGIYSAGRLAKRT